MHNDQEIHLDRSGAKRNGASILLKDWRTFCMNLGLDLGAAGRDAPYICIFHKTTFGLKRSQRSYF